MTARATIVTSVILDGRDITERVEIFLHVDEKSPDLERLKAITGTFTFDDDAGVFHFEVKMKSVYKFICNNCKREWKQSAISRKFCNRCGSSAVKNLSLKAAEQVSK